MDVYSSTARMIEDYFHGNPFPQLDVRHAFCVYRLAWIGCRLASLLDDFETALNPDAALRCILQKSRHAVELGLPDYADYALH